MANTISSSLINVSSKRLELKYVASNEVKYYFSSADLVVLPYRHFDAQSGPGNIALAFEKPLLVSAVGGLPDLVISKNAIFKAGDVNELSQKIYNIFTKNLFQALKEDSKVLKKKYSWDSIADQTVSLYNRI